MFCKNCGKEVADDAYVCDNCGTTLKKATLRSKLSSTLTSAKSTTILCLVMTFATLFFLLLSTVTNLSGLSYFGVHPSDYEKLSNAIDRMFGILALFDTLFVSLMSTISVCLGLASVIATRKEKEKKFISIFAFIFSILVWLFVFSTILVCSIYAGKILSILCP